MSRVHRSLPAWCRAAAIPPAVAAAGRGCSAISSRCWRPASACPPSMGVRRIAAIARNPPPAQGLAVDSQMADYEPTRQANPRSEFIAQAGANRIHRVIVPFEGDRVRRAKEDVGRCAGEFVVEILKAQDPVVAPGCPIYSATHN